MWKTETRNQNTLNIDQAETGEMLRLIQFENENAAAAVGKALPAIERACDSITEGFKAGGRLIYIGAGSSGRLGVLDAVECPPTYGVSPELVSGIIAGGAESMFRASEGAEDDGTAGVLDISKKQLTPSDCVVGISAAGNAAYVAEALSYARSIGCVTIGVTSNYGSRLDLESDISIVTDTGAEAITGSTRMKAGSAQKMVLNMLSTCAMIKTGKVYQNLMINLCPSNEKLKKRVISIVCDILGCGADEAIHLLNENDWSIRDSVEKNQRKELQV